MARNHEEKEGFEEYTQAFGKARTLGYPLEAKELVEKNHDSVPDAIKEQRTIAGSTARFHCCKIIVGGNADLAKSHS